MKNFLFALFIFILSSTLIISCTKSDLSNPAIASQNLNSASKVNPNVLDCGIGFHWDFYLKNV